MSIYFLIQNISKVIKEVAFDRGKYKYHGLVKKKGANKSPLLILNNC